MVRWARIAPASGPESNSAAMVSVPGVCDWGTRTEAGQKVPQAKPEWTESSARPSVVARTTVEVVSWSIPGAVGEPR